MRTLRGLAALTVVLSVGCAGNAVPVNPSTPGTVTPVRGVATIEGSTLGTDVMSIKGVGGEATVRISAATPAVWQALLRAYAGLGVTVTQIDTAALTVHVGNQRLRRVGGVAVSELFYCTGAYENLAASGRVMGEVTTRLVPYTDGSVEARTQVVATVSRNAGGPATPCPSTGKLEQLIHNALHRELGDTIRK